MAQNTKQTHQDSVSGVVRTFQIIEAVSRQDQIGLSDLSRILHLHKSTLYRFLTTMCELGYLRRDENTQEYAITMKLFQLGSAALERMDVVPLSRPVMDRLAEQTSETVHLAATDSAALVYLHKIDSRHTLRMYSRVGKRAPLYCTGLGKALLAWKSDQEVRSLFPDDSFQRHTDRTITTLNDLLKELIITKRRGYALDNEEHERGIRCVAAPVFDRSGEPCAAISVSWPSARVDEKTAQSWIPLVRESAAIISEALGGSFPPTAAAESAGTGTTDYGTEPNDPSQTTTAP
jgi:IclR family KDG regulon transcriptional repressor